VRPRVLVDTTIWSAAFRHRSPDPSVAEAMTDLIAEGRVVLLGLVRQEFLSGIRDPITFEKLRRRMRAFLDEPIDTLDHEQAAAYYNTCQTNGVQGSHADFLIAAAAARRQLQVYTADKDFVSYSDFIPIDLYSP
jgi:predicted nucleic acid-binding protein